VIAAANIGSCNVSSLTAGTATFSSTVTFANSSGPSVIITSTEVEVTGGAYTIAVNSSSGISISSSSASLDITSSSLTLTAGSFGVVVSSSQVQFTSSGATATFSSTALNISPLSGGQSAVLDGAGALTLTGLTTSSKINGGIAEFEGSVTVGTPGGTNCQMTGTTSSSATAGSQSLPSAPAGFLDFYLDVNSGGTGGTHVKIPYYNA
jgi:hypothetical protein